MNKEELIDKLARKCRVSPSETADIVNIFLAEIRDSLTRGEKVVLTGFGTFSISERKAKLFINPRTGREHQLPERIWPHFKASGDFKKTVREEE